MTYFATDKDYARVVGEPQLKYSPSNKAVLNFRAVINHRRKQGDQFVETGSTWLNVSVWGKQGENAAAELHDKDLVALSGQLETRDYEKDGEKRTSLDLAFATVTKAMTGGASAPQTPVGNAWSTTPPATNQPADVWGATEPAPF